jgi:hypothetical protein
MLKDNSISKFKFIQAGPLGGSLKAKLQEIIQ